MRTIVLHSAAFLLLTVCLISPEIAKAAGLQLIAPSGSIASSNPEFRWRSATGASTYLFRVLKENGQSAYATKRQASAFGCASGNACSYRLDQLAAGRYSWQVRPFNGDRRQEWSDALAFNVAASGSGTSTNSGGTSGAGADKADIPVVQGAPIYPSIFKPPQPLANLRIEQLQPKGIQSFNGPGNQDLLLVAPNQVVDEIFEVRVEGFRGIYLIGGTFNVKPQGWLTTPNGKKVYGMAKVFQFKLHANPVSRPFVYVSKLKILSNQVSFGDIFQIGGSAGTNAMRNWMDFYAWKIKADAPVGWGGYYGGSFSKNVSHSDFVIKTGAVRNVYVGNTDVAGGYQHFFTVPGWTTGRTAYRGPEGIAETHYWSTVSRIKVNSAIGSVAEPTVFFMAIGSGEVAQGQYATHYFHEGNNAGAGNYIVPLPGKGSILTHVHPENGNYAPTERANYLEWNQTSFPGGNRFVVGRVYHGGKLNPPTVVRDSEIGFRNRVTNRQELLTEINGGYRN